MAWLKYIVHIDQQETVIVKFVSMLNSLLLQVPFTDMYIDFGCLNYQCCMSNALITSPAESQQTFILDPISGLIGILFHQIFVCDSGVKTKVDG